MGHDADSHPLARLVAPGADMCSPWQTSWMDSFFANIRFRVRGGPGVGAGWRIDANVRCRWPDRQFRFTRPAASAPCPKDFPAPH